MGAGSANPRKRRTSLSPRRNELPSVCVCVFLLFSFFVFLNGASSVD